MDCDMEPFQFYFSSQDGSFLDLTSDHLFLSTQEVQLEEILLTHPLTLEPHSFPGCPPHGLTPDILVDDSTLTM